MADRTGNGVHMLSARRVLVVDDEPTVIKGCRRILAQDGYEVAAAESGRDGMNRAFTERFDLVMTDLRMPDLDGMELVRALRRERPRTAVIVITGYGTVPSAVEATRLGVSEYIEKPFTPEDISQAASRALGTVPEKREARIEADLVREVLRKASRDQSFGASLLYNGSRILSGFTLSSEAKAAIISGDLAWIEKRCGDLSAEERDWLMRRLEAEIW
jgi:DNA-binding NtrC family response regulator